VGLKRREIPEAQVLQVGGQQRRGRELQTAGWRCWRGINGSHWNPPANLFKVSPIGEATTISASSSTSSSGADPQTLQAEIASLSSQLEEARDEAELNLLMLQQVQEELETYFLAHQQQEQLLQQQRQQLHRAEGLIQALLERVEQQG